MKKIFYSEDKIWKGFVAPEQPNLKIMAGKPARIDKYKEAYAEAKRNALPVLNPEIGIVKSSSGEECMFDGYIGNHRAPYYKTIKEGEEYSWPGDWEVKDKWINGKVEDHKIGSIVKFIVLSLPNQPVKITPEQADKVKEGMDLWRGKDEPVKPESKTKTGARYIPKPENSGHGFSEGGDFEKFSLLKHVETTAIGSTDKPESPKEGEGKIMNYQDLDEMAIAYLEMQYDPGYVRARLAENNYAPNWKLIIQSFKAGVYTIVGKQKQELQSPKEGEEKRILQQAKEYQKNLPSGKREHFTGYIDGATAELHNTSQSYNDYLNEKEAELQSLRDQLAAKEEEYTLFKKGVAKGSELYAHLRFDDEPFTPYQLALQKVESLEEENRKLKEALKEFECYFKSISIKREKEIRELLAPNQ